MLLTTLGVRVVTFSTAEDFLGRVNAESPCFLITELELPGGGGFELKKALDERGIRVPVIGLTGEVNQKNTWEASQLGFLELIEKPFVYWSIVERVQQTLETPR
jgi:FixJ family two-component response regulator